MPHALVVIDDREVKKKKRQKSLPCGASILVLIIADFYFSAVYVPGIIYG